jgi:hypothetical protein
MLDFGLFCVYALSYVIRDVSYDPNRGLFDVKILLHCKHFCLYQIKRFYHLPIFPQKRMKVEGQNLSL